jgi:uncharacterized protein (TIGR00255 family)
MSLRSMTGHGSGEAAGRGVRVFVDLSSINRRQLEISLNLPKSIGALESRIQETLHAALARGRITGDVALRFTSGRGRDRVVVDEDLAAQYVSALRRTARRLRLRDDIQVSQLLSWPDVVQSPALAEDLETRVWPVMNKALHAALSRLQEMKRREGAALGRDLERRLRRLDGRLRAIRSRLPRVVRHHRQALLRRIREAGVGLDARDERVIKEVALFADRSDVSEEVTRLESHLNQARRLLNSEATTGKTLDFLAQEMFREINTMGAKANDSAVVHHVVAFKSELERVREQVQNLE